MAAQSEEGAAAAGTNGGVVESDEKATGETTVAIGEEGDDEAVEGESNHTSTGSSSGQTNDSRVRHTT